MSTEYYIYSEVYNDNTNKYELLNRTIVNKVSEISEDYYNFNIAETIYGKSYLYDLYKLIRDYGNKVDNSTLDLPLHQYKDDVEKYEISYNKFINLYKNLKKNHGYVFIDELEDDEFDEYYSIKEYMQITDSEVKSKLKYHEWYTQPDLANSMKDVIEHTKWLLYDYNSLINTSYEMENVRFILAIFY